MPPTAAVNDGGAEARFQAKWGRNIPSRDVALTVTASGSNLPAGNGAAERFRLKFGRSMPANAASGGTGPVLAAGAAHPTACEQPCCKQAD